jgi:imidazolonepropionase-like amidohydrolase/ABC-type multidrug transport system permease subunit
MAAYIALIRTSLRLTMRDRTVLFFNYLFPLIFFFIFAQAMHAEQGGMINQVVNMVLTIGVLGSGFFGAGMRAVSDREQNILRRFKVAPISPMPILVSAMITGIIHYMPVLFIVLTLSHFLYGMPIPPQWPSLAVFLIAGVFAFRALGLIVAAVVNSMQESGLVTQLLYLPMLFLSGATFPISIMPVWLQIIAQFLPATHFFTGMQAILGAHESLLQNLQPFFALLLCGVVGLFISSKLFRWEKGEKVRPAAKVWVLGVMAPFLILGVYQAYTKENVAKNKALDRDLRRSQSLLFRNARIFVGNGEVIETGSVLVRNGHIEEVFAGPAPDAKSLKAEEIEAAGKTLLPGLIDVHVHLASPGGFSEKQTYNSPPTMSRALAAYLFSGVTAVKSVGDPLDAVLKQRAMVASGEWSGAELFLVGPMFTIEGGHGTEYFKELPEQIRKQVYQQTLRLPKTPEEARRQVDELKGKGVDGIKAILEAGWPGMLFERMDLSILRAVAAESRAQKLPIVVHTGDSHDVADALEAGVDGIEHGSARDVIPVEILDELKQSGAAYDPTLSVLEAVTDLQNGKTDLLNRSLVQQIGPSDLLEGTKKFVQSDAAKGMFKGIGNPLTIGTDNLHRAWQAGAMLVTGTDSGNPMLIHGPALHRELQLWVKAGIPAAVALQAATYNGARLLRADSRIGLIRKGYEATLLLVDGNPLEDISATERISMILFKGEHIGRSELFKQK